jgi:hypothetical protein
MSLSSNCLFIVEDEFTAIPANSIMVVIKLIISMITANHANCKNKLVTEIKTI